MKRIAVFFVLCATVVLFGAGAVSGEDGGAAQTVLEIVKNADTSAVSIDERALGVII